MSKGVLKQVFGCVVLTSSKFNLEKMYTLLITLLGFLLTLVFAVYLHTTRNFNYWKNKSVQYVKPVPIFGNIYKVITMQIGIAEHLGRLYNTTQQPYLGFFVFNQPFLLIRDSELMKRCLIKDFDYFDDRSITENMKNDKVGSSVLFVIKNPAWKRVRTKFSPIFATTKLQKMLFLIIEASSDLTGYIMNSAIKEQSTETKDIILKYTTYVISSCAFGINAHCFKNDKALFRELSRSLLGNSIWRKIQLFSYYFAPFLVKLFKMKMADPNSTRIFYDIVKTTIEEREKSKNYSRGDVIDQLIKIKTENKIDASETDLSEYVAQTIQFFAAGFETTSSTITFALYEMSLNHVIQAKLAKEAQAICEKHGGITYEGIQEMTYLDMVLKETLRKYPIVPFVDRRCKKDYQISGTDIKIDKGVPVFIPLVGLHYDPDYFPNPEKFDPDRFSPKNLLNITHYNYMPFGRGPHNCIGERFGIMTAKVAIISIIKDFQVEPCSLTQIPIKFDVRGFLICPQDEVHLCYRQRC